MQFNILTDLILGIKWIRIVCCEEHGLRESATVPAGRPPGGAGAGRGRLVLHSRPARLHHHRRLHGALARAGQPVHTLRLKG